MYILLSRYKNGRANHSLSGPVVKEYWTVAYENHDLAEVVRQRNMCLDLLHEDKTDEQKRELYKIVREVPEQEFPK